ncbi:MAG TPA: hypothetical protein VHB30_05080 [Solirubrobacteraceae bacterium]|nr:hypothetical protein [Solirubrobacteraceae bacterium]
MSIDLRERLAATAIPGADAARRHTADVVESAFAQPRPTRRRRRSRHRLVPFVVAALVALAGGASAIAGAGPGHAIAHWVRDIVAAPARPLGSLPGGGRLLVTGDGAWLLDSVGARHRLGDYDDAAWSPHGLYVAVTSGPELAAVDPGGAVRWRLTVAGGSVRRPRWSPDGYRIAYRVGDSLRVVAGDGSGDHLVARRAMAVAPAWRPDRSHTLAWLTPGGTVFLGRADGGGGRVASAMYRDAIWLGWADRRHLLVATPTQLFSIHPGSDPGNWQASTRRDWHVPRGETILAAAVSPSRLRLAVLLERAGTTVLELRDPRTFAPVRTVAAVRGTGRDMVWAPDGRHVIVSLPRRGRWLLAATSGSARPRLLTAVAGAFGTRAAAPRGWAR